MKKHKHTENNNIPKQELENENLETEQTKQNQKQEKKDPLLERIDVLTCKNNELEKNVNNWKNKYYEAYANLENTRKQIEKDNNEYRKYMAIQVIENLIPCFDAMEATIKFAPEDPQIKKFLQGFNMIFNMFLKRLEEIDFKTYLPQKGDDFDSKTMNATETVESDVANKINEVQCRCYTYKDRLIRPANVIVTKLAAEKQVTEQNQNDKGE